MKKELSIFIGLFLFLAIGMHFKEWMDHPIEHAMALPTAGAIWHRRDTSIGFYAGYLYPVCHYKRHSKTI